MKKNNGKLYTILSLIVLAILIYFAENNLDAYNLRILNLGAIYVTLGVKSYIWIYGTVFFGTCRVYGRGCLCYHIISTSALVQGDDLYT